MKTLGNGNEEKVSEWWDKVRAEASEKNMNPFALLASQSEGIKQILIRWLKEDIAELESIKSEHE